jgi:amino acid transporter
MTAKASPPELVRGLKSNSLSYSEVLAQSISVIAPSTVPAAVVGLIFAQAGNGTWLSFALGLMGMLFVGININQFARRSASPGSLYTYIVKGLGPTAGILSGWALLLGYMATGMSTLCGFAIFGQLLLGSMGLHTQILTLFVVGTAIAGFVAYRDISLSAKMMLYFEGVSILSILILGVIVWVHKGFAIDHAQLTLEGATPGGMLTGVMLVVFGFSGFESATSLGEEAKDPLRTIPRSLTQSTLISGAFFIFMAYVIVFGFKETGIALGATEAPLDFLAPRTGFGFLGTVINIGALLSFFACTLACINSMARIFFSMARHGLLHDALGDAHEKNETPHIAVVLSAIVTFLAPVVLVHLFGIEVFRAQGYFGTLASFGFLLVYMLVSAAAPVYLRSIGKLRPVHILYSVFSVGFIILPIVGTVGIPGSDLFPPPEFPANLFVWIFAAYMAIGLGGLIFQRRRSPQMIHELKNSVEEIHQKFGDVKRVS